MDENELNQNKVESEIPKENIIENKEPKVQSEIKKEVLVEEVPASEPVKEEPEPVEEKKPEETPIAKKGKEGSFMPMIFIMIASLVIVSIWDKVPAIQNAVHSVLDPTAGFLLNWNLTVGMFVIVFVITLITTIIQKYATDQDALRELKKEQKILQEEMKKYKDHPEKVAELSKKQFAFMPKTFKLTSRAIMFTGIPFILFFRWFNDVFTTMEVGAGAPIKFFGFLGWFWFYLISAMIFSGFLRKWLKVV